MKQNIRRKLQATKGETIAEVLVSLLISSLALVMLATMIRASSNMILTSETKLEAYYDESIKLSTQATEEKESDTLTVEIVDGENTVIKTVDNVSYYKNDIIGTTDVISYKAG